MLPSSATTTPVPYSTVLRGGGPACGPVGKGVNALDIAITTGSTVFSTAWSYRIVMMRTSSPLNVPRT
jgi:hypothetical protein